ncbi:HAD family hydrolase [Acetivibrio clariflavus]|uniref:Haloacid dehalogenase superfamily enzyme, subfamily IA n=1 Tax=Acetivibrio clariflavus (strain DSM 19732 / NBRC 101661 / EBR45) TaxID=720554 RepID=G8LWU9_ACECE|nr:HAD family phosphatase [Acetivibrio clariflavus]AEV69810.1 haloacid dehalogenase superfamily enzyme, subfamily IA [Acetivibrio clariflavus DSM 19732]
MKAIIFDMDGLMIDTEIIYHETDRKIAESFGKTVSEETLGKMMGRKPIESYRIFCDDLGIEEPIEQLLKTRYDLVEKMLLQEIKPMPGLFDILDEFKGKMKMAIATGSPHKFLEIALDKLNIREYFDVTQPSDGIVNGKPDPEIYLKVMEKLKLGPEYCIVIEDSSNGARAGKNAGCYTIAVPSEYTYKQDFSFVDYVAIDLKDAREHIKKLLSL